MVRGQRVSFDQGTLTENPLKARGARQGAPLFFKNPVVNQETAGLLAKEFAGLPVYSAGNDSKLSAAWMIEQCGWKGRSMGRAAVSEQHALVLINTGNATGGEILNLAEAIQASVQERFGTELQPEPLIIK